MHSHNPTSGTSRPAQLNHTLLTDRYEPGDVYGVILGESRRTLVFAIGEDAPHEIRLVRPTDDTWHDGLHIYSGPLALVEKPPHGLGEEGLVNWIDSFAPRLHPVPDYPTWTQATRDSDDTRPTTEFLDDARGTGPEKPLAVIHGRNGRQLALRDDGLNDHDCYLAIRGPGISDSLRANRHTLGLTRHTSEDGAYLGAELCTADSTTLAQLRQFTVLQR
jgi:hypothetical protein